MSNKIRIEKRLEFTIYHVGEDKFRIVQNSEQEFVINKLFKREIKTGFFPPKKTICIHEWVKCDKDGNKIYSYAGLGTYITNVHRFTVYKSLEEAIKWIEDYSKYPINH